MTDEDLLTIRDKLVAGEYHGDAERWAIHALLNEIERLHLALASARQQLRDVADQLEER